MIDKNKNPLQMTVEQLANEIHNAPVPVFQINGATVCSCHPDPQPFVIVIAKGQAAEDIKEFIDRNSNPTNVVDYGNQN